MEQLQHQAIKESRTHELVEFSEFVQSKLSTRDELTCAAAERCLPLVLNFCLSSSGSLTFFLAFSISAFKKVMVASVRFFSF